MMDEFLTKYYFSNRGSWTKKYGAQLGFKYVDAFGIANLDLQGEYNVARPYTYTHRDGGRNYTHFRQPLAHPLGANFREFLGIIRYKISPRLTAYGTLMWTKQGVDYDGKNWGGNLLPDYETRVKDFGNRIAQGVPLYTRFADLRVSYMLLVGAEFVTQLTVARAGKQLSHGRNIRVIKHQSYASHHTYR